MGIIPLQNIAQQLEGVLGNYVCDGGGVVLILSPQPHNSKEFQLSDKQLHLQVCL